MKAKRINSKVINTAIGAINELLADGKSVSWANICFLLKNKYKLEFSRQSLIKHEQIYAAYIECRDLQRESKNKSDELSGLRNFENHSKLQLIEQLENKKQHIEELQLQNQILIDDIVLIYQFVETRIGVGVRELSSYLDEHRPTLPSS